MNLLEHPEYIEDLRAEVQAELVREAPQGGNPPEFLGKTAFANMKKLDSFIKESMRYSGVFTGMVVPSAAASAQVDVS